MESGSSWCCGEILDSDMNLCLLYDETYRVSSAGQKEERDEKKMHKGDFSVLVSVWVYKLMHG